MKRGVYIFLGCLFIVIGLIYIFHAFNPITGWLIVDNIEIEQSGLSGLFFLFIGMHFLALTRKKRGQAAMEFLMTYGWAILASITALSLLAYFGVFGGGSLFGGPSKVILSPPFQGESTSINLDYIQVQVRNSASYSITIDTTSPNEPKLTNLPSGVTCTYEAAASSLPVPLTSGATAILVFSCIGLQEGQKINAKIDITYKKQGSNLPQTSSGTVSGTVPNTNACPAGQTLVNGVCTGGGGGGNNDFDAPLFLSSNIEGDSSSPYLVTSSTANAYITTDEPATCRTAYSVDTSADLSYTSMGQQTECDVTGGISHTCRVSTAHANYNMYVACVDASPNQNENDEFDNLDLLDITVDLSPPVQSNWNPTPGSVVGGTFTMTFNLNENGDCKAEINNDVGYSQSTMDCTGDGTQSMSCSINTSSLPLGIFTVYTSCQDAYGHADTSSTNTETNYDKKSVGPGGDEGI